VWEEGKGPDVVIEVTSLKTRHQDETEKPAIYAKLGVQEYFLYDPLREYLDPPLQGYRRTEAGSYAPIPTTRKHDHLLTVPSQVFNMELHLEEMRLRLYDTDQATYLLSYEESIQVRHLIDEHVKLVEEQQQQAEEQRQLAEEQQEKVKELWKQADNHREKAEEHWQQAQKHWQQAEELFTVLDEKLAYIRQPKPPKP
jgi:Uma2 family endonuclease